MKLGFVSAILADFTFEEMIDCASEMGYQCVEVACWPQGKADTEYEVFIEQASAGKMKTNLGGKLSFSVELGNAARVEVKIVKC